MIVVLIAFMILLVKNHPIDFLNGGSIPFPFGTICPLCNGAGKRPVESSEGVHLMVIFDPKEFMDIGTINSPDGLIQTMAKKEMTPKLQRANQIIVSTDVSGFFSSLAAS